MSTDRRRHDAIDVYRRKSLCGRRRLQLVPQRRTSTGRRDDERFWRYRGGFFLFGIGFLLSVVSAYLLFDSVYATSGHGFFSGMLGGRGRGGVGMSPGHGQTTSMGVIFLPFLIGIMALFYDASKKWAWAVMYIGLGIIAIEIFTHLRFHFSIKTSHLILMMGMFAAGVGMMLRSYRDTGQTIDKLVTGETPNSSSLKNPAAKKRQEEEA